MQNITEAQYFELMGLTSDFAFNKIKPHEETAFRKKIFPYISEEMLEEMKTSEEHKHIYVLILKAAANYTIVGAIPFIKVNINAFGIDNHNDEKMKTANWYDVRDLGLSLLKIADEAISDAITEIGKVPELKAQCDFFKKYSFAPIPTPEEFDSVYSINKSMDVYLQIAKIMRRVWQNSILGQIKNCTVDQITANEDLAFMLKDALVYYSLGHALGLSQFTFISSGLVMQYDELPWQKSVILSDQAKENLSGKFAELASGAVSTILKHLKDYPDDFPCYEPETTTFKREIIVKNSGLYL